MKINPWIIYLENIFKFKKKKKLMKTSSSKDVYTTRELYLTAIHVMYIEETV